MKWHKQSQAFSFQLVVVAIVNNDLNNDAFEVDFKIFWVCMLSKLHMAIVSSSDSVNSSLAARWQQDFLQKTSSQRQVFKGEFYKKILTLNLSLDQKASMIMNESS